MQQPVPGRADPRAARSRGQDPAEPPEAVARLHAALHRPHQELRGTLPGKTQEAWCAHDLKCLHMRFHFHATSRPATFDNKTFTSMFSIRDGLPVLLALRVRVQPLHLRQRRGLGRRRHQGRHGKSRLTQEMNEQSTMNVKGGKSGGI